MIYFDNAATTFPKPIVVIDAMQKYMKESCANPGRSGHAMAILASKEVMKAREIIGKFFGIKNPLRIYFTKNATEALNIAIKGYIKDNQHIIISPMEHNSVIRPINFLKREKEIKVSIMHGSESGEIDLKKIDILLKKNTQLFICTISSNVDGSILPIKEIGEFCKQKGVTFLVDASQGAGSIDINVEDMNIDMMAFPGHKGLLGPQGIGGLYIKEGLIVKELLQGGTGSLSKKLNQPTSVPDVYESGTLNTPGIVGLRTAIEYINSIGLKSIQKHKFMLINKLYEGLSEFRGIKIFSPNSMLKNSGILSINVDNYDSIELSELLDKTFNIATRGGLHCAPLAHKTLGTLKIGVVRFSLGWFNKSEEVDIAIDAIKKIIYK